MASSITPHRFLVKCLDNDGAKELETGTLYWVTGTIWSAGIELLILEPLSRARPVNPVGYFRKRFVNDKTSIKVFDKILADAAKGVVSVPTETPKEKGH